MSPGHGDILYGRNAVAEAFRGNRQIHRLYVAEGVRWDARMQQIRSDAERRGVPVETTQRQVLDDTVGGERHQGVLLVTSPYSYSTLSELLESAAPVLILDHLQDPQNVGTLLRSAEVFGVSWVIIPKDRSASITPAVVNASAGSVEHLSIVQETNISRVIDMLKQQNYWIVGLDNAGDVSPIHELEVSYPFGLVVGAEGSGLSRSISGRCDFLARIEQLGQIESLNAAVAGSIALYHLTRQHASSM
ncbi:MAG: 23S rRNA (guanosine(2251)-2'-O)-methyltransferase RlmB [Thermomicrobiales bacterium]